MRARRRPRVHLMQCTRFVVINCICHPSWAQELQKLCNKACFNFKNLTNGYRMNTLHGGGGGGSQQRKEQTSALIGLNNRHYTCIPYVTSQKTVPINDLLNYLHLNPKTQNPTSLLKICSFRLLKVGQFNKFKFYKFITLHFFNKIVDWSSGI